MDEVNRRQAAARWGIENGCDLVERAFICVAVAAEELARCIKRCGSRHDAMPAGLRFFFTAKTESRQRLAARLCAAQRPSRKTAGAEGDEGKDH